jgi:hypothetical protein
MLQWACSQCEKKKVKNIHPWVRHLNELHQLIKAGYPFGKNDLSFQEWRDLGILTEAIEIKKRGLFNGGE